MPRRAVGLIPTELTIIKNGLSKLPIDSTLAYLAIHSDGSVFKIFDGVWSTITHQSLAKWISDNKVYDNKNIVLLSCNDPVSSQKLATELGQLDHIAQRKIRKVISWTGEVKVFENGLIAGVGDCMAYIVGIVPQKVAVPPTGKAKVTATGKFVKLGESTTVSAIRANWRVTHPPGTQDDRAITEIQDRIKGGDMWVWMEQIVTFEYGGVVYLIDGHHRITAAVKMNYSGYIPIKNCKTIEELRITHPHYKTAQDVVNDSFTPQW